MLIYDYDSEQWNQFMIVGSGISMGHIMMYGADWVFLNLTLKYVNFIQMHFAIVFEKQLVLRS